MKHFSLRKKFATIFVFVFLALGFSQQTSALHPYTPEKESNVNTFPLTGKRKRETERRLFGTTDRESDDDTDREELLLASPNKSGFSNFLSNFEEYEYEDDESFPFHQASPNKSDSSNFFSNFEEYEDDESFLLGAEPKFSKSSLPRSKSTSAAQKEFYSHSVLPSSLSQPIFPLFAPEFIRNPGLLKKTHKLVIPETPAKKGVGQIASVERLKQAVPSISSAEVIYRAKGSQATVFQVSDDDETYALRVKKGGGEAALKLVQLEVERFSDKHYLAAAHEILDTAKGHKLLVAKMDWFSRGTLENLIDNWLRDFPDQAIPENNLWQYILDLGNALLELKSEKFLHQDIKPENILVADNGRLKIADFGMSTLLESDEEGFKPTFREGDTRYMSPELQCCEDQDATASYSADVFSVGMTIFEIAAWVELPTEGQNWDKIRNGDFNDKLPKSYSENLRDLIINMIAKDQNARPSAEDIVAIALQNLN